MPLDEFADGQAAASGLGNRSNDSGCATCHQGNWIHVRYDYTEGDPVTDAAYVVQKPNDGKPGGEVLAEGVLAVGPNSTHQYAHVDLGGYDGEVEVFFFDDPTEPAPFTEPAPVKDERNWLQRAADAVVGGATWIGEVGMGDFNEDMTTGQIITNAVVTAVPVVDQVADARDLVANGKALIWDKRYNELGVWVGVFACLIGLIPSLGSLAKGVIKIIWKNAGELGQVIIYINKALHRTGMRINGYRFVKRLGDEVVSRVGEVRSKFDEFLDSCLSKARLFGMTGIIPTIEHVRGMANEKFAQVAAEISSRISRGLARFATQAWKVLPGQGIIVRRALTATRHLGPHPSWLPTMTRRIDIDELEPGARTISAADRTNFIRLREMAESWADELIASPATPASIRDLDRSILVDVMTTFGAKPTVKIFRENESITVYRVVGNESQAGGPFWSRAEPPDTEEAWRARDAVLNEWNDGGAFVRSTIPPPDAILQGPIGPQDLGRAAKAPKPGQMLEGGGEQLWLPRHAQGPATRIDGYYHTPWNAPVNTTRAVVRAGNANECDL